MSRGMYQNRFKSLTLMSQVSAVSIQRADPEEVTSYFENNPDGDLEHLGDMTIGFKVLNQGTNDYDHQDRASRVPFQIAYATSIHKAQGLEYDSVRIVITGEASERVSHSVFYTAITRTKNKPQIFWSLEVQRSVLEGLTKISRAS